MRRNRLWPSLVVAMFIAAVAAACGTKVSFDRTSESNVDKFKQFETFAGFPVPADAELLGIEEKGRIDTYVAVAFAVAPERVQSVLDGARVSKALAKGRWDPSPPVFPGVTFDSAAVQYAGATIDVPTKSGSHSVHRDVFRIDEAARTILVVVAFTT
jgi:hypothetical protein